MNNTPDIVVLDGKSTGNCSCCIAYPGQGSATGNTESYQPPACIAQLIIVDIDGCWGGSGIGYSGIGSGCHTGISDNIAVDINSGKGNCIADGGKGACSGIGS